MASEKHPDCVNVYKLALARQILRDVIFYQPHTTDHALAAIRAIDALIKINGGEDE